MSRSKGCVIRSSDSWSSDGRLHGRGNCGRHVVAGGVDRRGGGVIETVVKSLEWNQQQEREDRR